MLEEALLARAKQSGAGRRETDAILDRYAAMPTLDSRPEAEIMQYDEIGLPK